MPFHHQEKIMPSAPLAQLHTDNETAAYSEWLAAEIQAAIDDPRPRIPHEEVMAEMEADIAALTAKTSSND
jgi:hypothetical protein